MAETNDPIFNTGIYKAVVKAGTVATMAKALNVSRQVIYIWLKRGFAPTIRAIQIEEIYGISRVDLMDPTLLRGSLADMLASEASRARKRVTYKAKAPVDDLV